MQQCRHARGGRPVPQAGERAQRRLTHRRLRVVERAFHQRHAFRAAERAEQQHRAGAHIGVGRDRQRAGRREQARIGHGERHFERAEQAGAIRGGDEGHERHDRVVAQAHQRVLRGKAAPAIAVAEHLQKLRHHVGLGPMDGPFHGLGAHAGVAVGQ